MNPEEELNPITGLPRKKPRINRISGLPVDPSKEGLPFTGDPMAYGFTRDMSDYTSRGIRVTPYQDIDEQRAERQGTLETWGRGIRRAGTTFGTALGTTVIGGIEGVARLEDQLRRGGLDEVNLYDAFTGSNQSAQYLNELNNRVREDLPIFKTAEEDSRQGTLQDIFSAHYIAGDFLDAMAYVGAAAASMWLTGGAGLGSLTASGIRGGLNLAARVPGVKAAMAATKATRAFQAGASATAASSKYMAATYSALAATKAARAVRAIPGFAAASTYVSTIAPRKQILAKAIDSSFYMSTSEAAVEALETKEQSKQKLLQEALKKYNVEREEDLPIQVRQNIEIASNNLAGVGYAANLPMLMLTNSIFFSLLKPIQASSIKGIGFKGGKAIYNPGSMAKRTAKFLGLDAASEAVQEGYQWGIQQQLINNELNKYNDMGSVATFHELMKDRERYFADAINKTPDLFNQLLKAPFDPEGRSAMITGALVGSTASAMRLGITKPFAEEDARGKMAETLLNSEYFSDLREKAARSNRVATHLKNKEFFEKQGDTEAAERELAAAFQEEAIFHVKNGTWEAFLKRIELESEKPLDQFKEDYQIKDDNFTEEDRQRIVDRLADNLSDLAMFHTNLEFVFPGTKMPTGLKKKFYSKEKLAEIENKRKEESIYKNAILRSHFTIKTINTQLDKVFEDLNSKIPGIAEKLQELKDVKRNLFGELLSKKELQDTDMFEKIRLTNKELVEKFEEIDNLISDPVQKLIFDQYKENIYDLMQERDTYELAKTNLTRSPEKRDLFLSRMKLAEENKIYEEREKIIQSAIDEAQTSKDLSDRKQGFKNELDEHPSLKTRLEDEITKKLAEEDEIDKRFHSMTKSEVQALDPSKLSPQEAYVRTLHLAKRTEEKAKPTEKKESKKPTKETTEPKEKEKEKEKTKKANTTRAANIKRNQGKKVADKALKLISLRNTNRHTDAAGVSRGQFEITQISVNNKAVDAVVVDSNGNPTPGLATRTLNGTPIIDFQLLGSPQVAKNDQVELKVIRDDWWVNSALAKEDEELHYKNIPIYIVHNGTPIGILQSGDHPARQAAFEADKTGGKVTTTISDKNRGYIFTGVETSPNGTSVERHFYNLKESDNSANTPENIIAIVNTSGVKTTLDLSAEANEQIALSVQTELSTGNLTYGQVVRIETAPTGKLVPLPVQTATLNEDAQQTAIRLILEGKVLEFQTLVGTNSLINPTENPKSKFPLWIEYVGDKTFFIFKPKFVSKTVEISRELTNLIEENDDNVFVRIELEDLQHMLQNNGFDDREITAETIMNFLVKLEEEVDSETGDVRYMYNSYFERPLSSTEYFMIAKEVPSFGAEIFTDQLTVKRYNVDIDTLSSPETKFTSPVTGNSYKSYYEYLTSENEQAAVRNGSSAILATSYKNINTNPDGTGGSVFYDVELTLSPEFEVDGVKQDIDNQILRTAPETFEEETEAEETQAPETKTETEVNLDALFNYLTSENEQAAIEVVSENYTPQLLRANPNKLFLFGDNNLRTGKGGQAIIRNEPNALGISTKLRPANTADAFMSDTQLAENKAVIDSDIRKAKERAAKEGKIIALPKGGFGTGLAALATKAPQTFAYLNKRLQEEFGFNNTTGELSALQPTQPTTVTKDAKINVKGALVSQGTSIELEIVGDTGKPFLLTVDRKGKITLFSEKQLDGSYIAGEYAPKEAVDKLYNKYVPEKTREAITNWVNAFTGSWAAPETEDGKRFDKVEKSLNAELSALEPTQPTAVTLDTPRFNPDNPEAISYPIKINGKYAGVISVDNEGYISSSIGMAGVELEEEFQGKGYGTKVYLALASKLAEEGKTLKSEFFGKQDINDSANRVWKSLLNEGLAVNKGDYFEVISQPTQPEEVKDESKKKRRRASIDLQEEQNEDGERLRNECNSDFDDSPF